MVLCSLPSKNSRSEESGSILLPAVIALSLLLLIVAGVINFAQYFKVRNEAQAAVDAAALAGAAGIPDYTRGKLDTSSPPQLVPETEKVEKLVRNFNGTPGASGTNTVNGENPDITLADTTFLDYDLQADTLVTPSDFRTTDAVQVTKTYPVPYAFGFGSVLPPNDVTVTATAFLAGVGCVDVDLPIMLLDCDISMRHCDMPCGQTNTFTFNGDNTRNSGSYFSFPGVPTNANDTRWWINNGGPPESNPSPPPATITGSSRICAGDTLNLNNGVQGSVLMDLENKCSAEGCSTATPWEVVLPFIDCLDLAVSGNNFQPNQSVPVSGFTKIGITGVVPVGSDRVVAYQYLCETADPNGGGGGAFCGLRTRIPILIR